MKEYTLKILKWSAIGLLIRLAIMPFTMHGQDLTFINYFPMIFVTKGIWDPYGFINNYFSHFPYTYYGPVLFGIMSMANFVFIKVFHAASLIKMLNIANQMMFRGLTTVDYVYAFSGLDVFKNLFVMKSPYLVFDFLIAWILLKMAAPKESALATYKLWMLNIVVIHSAYMVGGFDLIPATFIILALYFGMKKRPYASVTLLSLGGAAKLFPFIFVLPTCLLLGDHWKKRIALLFTAGLAAIVPYIPFYLSSGNAVFGTFNLVVVHYSGMIRWILLAVFALFYVLICLKALEESSELECEKKLLFYYLSIGLLVYAVIPISFRYFVFVTPLLALAIPGHRSLGMLTLFFIASLIFLRLPYRDLQLGLFAPVNPDYFMGLPTFQEIIGRYVNIEFLYKIMSRVLLVGFFIGAWWAWQLRLRTKVFSR